MPIPAIAAAIFASLAPKLAEQGMDLLSGVFSGAVTKGTEKVAELIEEKTGIKVEKFGGLTQDEFDKLREFEQQNKALILAAAAQADANDLKRMEVAASDTADARSLVAAAIKAGDRETMVFLFRLTAVLLLFAFGFIGWAAFGHNYETSPGATHTIDLATGFLLGTMVSTIIGFWFGTSLGSWRKNKWGSKGSGDTTGFGD